jgi:hypothetical protein
VKADGHHQVQVLAEGRRARETRFRLIDQRIRDLGGWRTETLARMRALILEADPAMTGEWKWDTPVWSHHGIVCTGEAYTKVVKLTFARGPRFQPLRDHCGAPEPGHWISTEGKSWLSSTRSSKP